MRQQSVGALLFRNEKQREKFYRKSQDAYRKACMYDWAMNQCDLSWY